MNLGDYNQRRKELGLPPVEDIETEVDGPSPFIEPCLTEVFFSILLIIILMVGTGLAAYWLLPPFVDWIMAVNK